MKKLYHIVSALVPVADAFAGTVYTDIINMQDFGNISFILQGGAGAVGTSTITVEACDDVAASHVSAVPFVYQECISGDTFGARTKASSFATAAAANKIYKIDVDAEALAASGYGYIRLKAVEVVNDPVTGGVLAILTEPKYAEDIFDTAIV